MAFVPSEVNAVDGIIICAFGFSSIAIYKGSRDVSVFSSLFNQVQRFYLIQSLLLFHSNLLLPSTTQTISHTRSYTRSHNVFYFVNNITRTLYSHAAKMTLPLFILELVLFCNIINASPVRKRDILSDIVSLFLPSEDSIEPDEHNRVISLTAWRCRSI